MRWRLLKRRIVVKFMKHVGLLVVVCGEYDIDDDVLDDLGLYQLWPRHTLRQRQLTSTSRLSSALTSSVSQTSWYAEQASR